jgi:hypothetical protein
VAIVYRFAENQDDRQAGQALALQRSGQGHGLYVLKGRFAISLMQSFRR